MNSGWSRWRERVAGILIVVVGIAIVYAFICWRLWSSRPPFSNIYGYHGGVPLFPRWIKHPHWYKFKEGGVVFVDKIDRVVLIAEIGSGDLGAVPYWPRVISEGMLKIEGFGGRKNLSVPWTVNSVICVSSDGVVKTTSIAEQRLKEFWQEARNHKDGILPATITDRLLGKEWGHH